MLFLGLGACTSEPLRLADDRPPRAEAVVLLAQISPAAISVDAVLDGAEQTVDLDPELADDRYGFRYRVEDTDGADLYERSTLGPVLVESFLDYWSGTTGIDILDALPTLGRFAIQVPLLEGADQIVFEVRDDAGDYALRGRFDLEDLDALRIAPEAGLVSRQELLHESGDPRDRLDIAIVGDGYREEELDLFREHADKVADRILRTEPFDAFSNRINIVRVDVASPASGASYDCPTCGYVENAFGSIFAIELVNRVSGSTYSSRALFQAEQWRVAHALAEVAWDQAIVLVNSEGYGGMAVHFATATTGPDDYADTAVHELGHSFGMLGDEYVFDACIRSEALGLPENVTDDPEDPPWDAWIDPGTPLPTKRASHGVGAFEGAWNCPDLYRPEASCKMNDGGPFCPVCAELLVRRLLRFSDPADGVRIDGRDLVVEGAVPGTRVRIVEDGEVVDEGPSDAPPRLAHGADDVEIEVLLDTPFVRSDPDGDLGETWTFHRPR